MRSKKEVLEDELSDNFLKQIDEQNGLLRQWIYDAMGVHASEYHEHLSEPQKDQETSKENLTISDVVGQSEQLICPVCGGNDFVNCDANCNECIKCGCVLGVN